MIRFRCLSDNYETFQKGRIYDFDHRGDDGYTVLFYSKFEPTDWQEVFEDESGWISVNDRLPEQTNEELGYSEEVLAFSNNFRGKYFISRYDHQDEMWGYEKGHDAEHNPISHWAPLPKPPVK